MLLDEPAKRRDNWDESNSVWIVLGDSQRWAFPKPWLTICPVFRGGRVLDSYPFYGYSTIDDELLEVVRAATDLRNQVSAVATLAARLLLHQYHLTDPELDTLLCFRDGEPDSEEWLRAVMRVATGESGPKVGCAG